MTRFLFDIDGTLTDSRKRINHEFEEFMIDFCHSNKVAFVTGSTKEKTIDQIGIELFNSVDYSFNCSGNEIWKQDNLIRSNSFEPEQKLLVFLEALLTHSAFPVRTGNHIEARNGMVNFTILGKNYTDDLRQRYIEWDYNTAERRILLNEITSNFPDLDVFIAGDLGLDIFPKKMGKEQVLDYLRLIETDKIYYFGDQIFPNGSDFNIAMKCNMRYNVKNWRETRELLCFLKEARYCI